MQVPNTKHDSWRCPVCSVWYPQKQRVTRDDVVRMAFGRERSVAVCQRDSTVATHVLIRCTLNSYLSKKPLMR